MERIVLSAVYQVWADTADAVIAQAIERFRLFKLGWIGFDQLEWVGALYAAHPEARDIALTCSIHSGGFMERVRDLFDACSKDDRLLMLNYFIGKLALEELSCRRSGSAAGLCDKKSAFLQIWHYLALRFSM